MLGVLFTSETLTRCPFFTIFLVLFKGQRPAPALHLSCFLYFCPSRIWSTNYSVLVFLLLQIFSNPKFEEFATRRELKMEVVSSTQAHN
jgi:hypothetical protein